MIFAYKRLLGLTALSVVIGLGGCSSSNTATETASNTANDQQAAAKAAQDGAAKAQQQAMEAAAARAKAGK